MKICQIVASHGEGGLEKHVIELCNGLSKTQQVTLVAPPQMQAYVAEAVRFVAFDFDRSRYNPLLLWDLLKILKQDRFDIVHAQASKAARLVGRLQNRLPSKVVATIHNNKAKRAGSFAGLAHVIAVSQGVAAVLPDSWPVTVVYNGIQPLSVDKPVTKAQLCDTFQLDASRPLLCSAARLVHAKGFDVLIEALQGVDANLLIAGDGVLKDALQAQIEQLNLQQRVKLLGHRSDLADLMSGVDAVVIASRNEGFSYVFVEALLQGQRIVSTDVPVANEVLASELMMACEPAPMRAKLNALLADWQAWDRLMQPALASAQAKFALAAMVSGTLDVYKKVLEG